MALSPIHPFPKLQRLPVTLPIEGAVRLELQEGIPVLRTSTAVQKRITALLHKQQASELSAKEAEELDQYEGIDDYLSFLNRVVRNLLQSQQPWEAHACRAAVSYHARAKRMYATGRGTCVSIVIPRSNGSTCPLRSIMSCLWPRGELIPSII